jgi:hypothetical protein
VFTSTIDKTVEDSGSMKKKMDTKKKFVERGKLLKVCVEMSIKMYREITNLSIDGMEVSIQ